jgi:hypothetical protein
VTSMQEALAAHYKVHLSTETLAELQENRTRSTDTCPMGTEVPSRAQNRIRSGRASRRAARNRQDLQAVGGVAGHWTRAALKPADYDMCKIRTGKTT